MKYFNPNYWFKLWIIVPFFNKKIQSINGMSIDNEMNCKNIFDITSTENLIYNQTNLKADIYQHHYEETKTKGLVLLDRSKRAKGKSGEKGKTNISLKNNKKNTKIANKKNTKTIRRKFRKITRNNRKNSNQESGTSKADPRNIEEKSLKKRKLIIVERKENEENDKKDNDKLKDFITELIIINENDISFILKLNKKQIQALNETTEIPHFSKEQIQAFTEWQIPWFTEKQIQAFNETTQIPEFREWQIQALTTTQIPYFEEQQIPWFTTEQIKAFTKEQIAAFTGKQIQTFKQWQSEILFKKDVNDEKTWKEINVKKRSILKFI